MASFRKIIEDLYCAILETNDWFSDILLPRSRSIWRPDRRPVRAIRMHGGNPDHPWGLSDDWASKGVSWLMCTMEYAYQKGFRRFMWSLPAGRIRSPDPEPWPSAQWQLLDDSGIRTISGSVRGDLDDSVTPWLRVHPDVQIIVYLGGVIKNAYSRDINGAWVPNVLCPRDRRIMQLNFDGFAALAPTPAKYRIGFWFDNSSTPEKQRKEYRVIEWLRSQSLWGGMEAVANKNRVSGDSSTNEPDLEYVRKVPMFGLRQFFDPGVKADPPANAGVIRDARSKWRFDPSTSEIGMFLHRYPIEKSHGLTPLQGEKLLRDYHERGFVLGTYDERWEELVIQITSGS